MKMQTKNNKIQSMIAGSERVKVSIFRKKLEENLRDVDTRVYSLNSDWAKENIILTKLMELRKKVLKS